MLRIAMLGLRMIHAVDAIARANDLKVRARIGIHSGPVVAGVIGTASYAAIRKAPIPQTVAYI
jgi:adenylate cyclase